MVEETELRISEEKRKKEQKSEEQQETKGILKKATDQAPAETPAEAPAAASDVTPSKRTGHDSKETFKLKATGKVTKSK